jgi:hypothetical protein
MKQTLLLAMLAALAAACDSAPAGPDPQPRPPLANASWHVHTAEGQPLPALVAHEQVNGLLQQTFLDSAHVSVTANGRWEQALFIQTLRGHERIAAVVLHDAGAWAATDSGYTFTSDLRGARYHLAGAPGDSFPLLLRAAELPGAIAASLRKERPGPYLSAAWAATHVNGQAMPGPLYLFDPDTLYGVPVSVHFIADSARLVILPNGRYRHSIWVSHWVGLPGGPPLERTLRLSHSDHGEWTRSGSGLEFESHYLQNHRMTGSFGEDGLLRMQHGFSHGDPPVPLVYGR